MLGGQLAVAHPPAPVCEVEVGETAGHRDVQPAGGQVIRRTVGLALHLLDAKSGKHLREDRTKRAAAGRGERNRVDVAVIGEQDHLVSVAARRGNPADGVVDVFEGTSR